jgi:hypothetical protein
MYAIKKHNDHYYLLSSKKPTIDNAVVFKVCKQEPALSDFFSLEGLTQEEIDVFWTDAEDVYSLIASNNPNAKVIVLEMWS